MRAARALLNWSQQGLAEKSGVDKRLITAAENGKRTVRQDNVTRIKSALEDYGVEFLEGDGVRLKAPFLRVLEGDNQYEQLLDDIYETVKDEGGTISIFSAGEGVPTPEERALTEAHIRRLIACEATERLLVCEGDTDFLAPHSWYRWLKREHYDPNSIMIYGDKMALQIWGPPDSTIIIHNPLLARAQRALFDIAWDTAIIPPGGGY
ncbi:MAG: helix-turn-helix domain-containing protein [Aquisalinus sp.]|nr:helix-turn-helix domain-containing protein [Aquisalinus sp.]